MAGKKRLRSEDRKKIAPKKKFITDDRRRNDGWISENEFPEKRKADFTHCSISNI